MKELYKKLADLNNLLESLVPAPQAYAVVSEIAELQFLIEAKEALEDLLKD